MFKLKYKKSFLKSLRFRAMIIIFIIGILPTFVLKYTMISDLEDNLSAQIISQVKEQAELLAERIGADDYLISQDQEAIDVQLMQISTLYHGRVLVVDQNFRIVRDTYGLDETKMLISENVIACFHGENTATYNASDEYICITTAIKDTVTKEVQGVLMFNLSSHYITQNMQQLGQKTLLFQIAAAIVILLVAYFMAGFLVKPFDKVTKSIEELSDGYMDEDISIPDFTETQLISEAFNKMLARMKVLDDSRQEFVSNVSHELKTPLTSMKVLADSLLAQEGLPAELYKEFMEDIAEEIDRENKIINDLLSLVKMDKKASDLNIQNINISDLVELILKRLRPIAKEKNIELLLESFKPVVAEVDEVKLTLAISNLMENAIKYNKADGWVHVSLNSDHKYFYIKVADSGMGIPEESIEHIFERFYRVDKSHSREIGGTGLGLAITRNAILMHRGAIKVFSKEGEGTTFTVRIPLAYIA